jgi:K+-sensing histidine kinase KdpD
LGSIITGLHLLKEEEAIKQLNSEAEELFDIIFQGGQRLEKDIEDSLRFITTPVLVQPEAGLHLSRLQTILSQLSTELELEPLTIVENVAVKDANIPLSEQAIELVLREILKNAKKFHPKKVPKVEISIHVPEEGRQICLEISDNGLTLSPDQLARIWMPYFQGEKYFTGQSTGMGLGLSSLAFLMWSIGGTYGAYNRKDKPGLTVELGIPIIMRQEDE